MIRGVKLLSIIFLLLFFCSTHAFGQDFSLLHFTVEDGLPSNVIYHVYRDSKGFLWICTDKGVARYNGIRFEKFTTLNGLADNEIFSCQEDKEGRLWFASYNGELSYFKDDSFHNAQNTPFLKLPHKHPHIENIEIMDDGTVMFVVYAPNYLCYIYKNKYYEVNLQRSTYSTNWILHIKKKDSVHFSLTTSRQIELVDIRNPSKFIPIESIYSKTGIDTILEARHFSQNQHYLISENAVYTDDLKLLRKPSEGFQRRNFIYKIYADVGGNFFYATNNGLFINDSIHILPNSKATCVTQDLNGNYWASTLNDGLYVFSKYFTNSSFYRNAYNGSILYATEIKGKLFYITDKNSVYLMEKGQNKLLADINNKLPKGANASFLIDTDYAFYCFTKQSNIFTPDILTEPLVCGKGAHPFIRSAYKKMFRIGNRLCLHTGFSVQAIDLNKFLHSNTAQYESIFGNGLDRIYGITTDNGNSLWFSTIDSVYKVVNNVAHAQSQFKNVALKNFVINGRCLVGYTHTNQLLVCEEINNKVRIDTILQECVWSSLYKLDTNHILIATNELYYLLTIDFSAPSLRYSLSAIEHLFIPQQAEAVCIGVANCYFFKNGAITQIKKEELLGKATPPALYFTNLKTSKKTYDITNFMEVPFSAAANITISFSALSFSGKNVIYQYSISKNNTDNWVNIKGDINLANPAFGVYLVKVRAKTISSGFSEPIVFTLSILRPFWATWWFITIAVCAVISLAWLTVRKYISTTINKKEKEHQHYVRFIKSEYKAMNALMNPHFIFNALNNVQSLVNNNDQMNASEYLGIFADLIRQNMNNIANETITLQKEMDLVENYLLLEKLRFEDQLNYTIEVADTLFLSEVMVPPLLIQPLVENSIKHGILPLKAKGVKGFIHISVYERANILYIEVKDNGVGIEKAKEKKSLHSSFGLENLKNRVQQLSIIQGRNISFHFADVKDDNGVQQWTIATISMSLS